MLRVQQTVRLVALTSAVWLEGKPRQLGQLVCRLGVAYLIHSQELVCRGLWQVLGTTVDDIEPYSNHTHVRAVADR